MEYKIIYASWNSSNNFMQVMLGFENEVQSYLNDGWELAGGVSITSHQYRNKIAQAITKDLTK